MLPAWRAGRRVVTNIPMFMDIVRAQPGLENAELVVFPLELVLAEPARLWEFVKAGDVFILDEAPKIFPAGEKVNKVPLEFRALLAEHGHMVDVKGNTLQVVLLVQDIANIGAWAQRLVETTFSYTKLSSVGASKTFRIGIYPGPKKGPSYGEAGRERMLIGTYKKSIYQFYNSHTMSESPIAGANEKSVDGRAGIWKRWAIMIGIPAGIVGVIAGFHYLGVAMEKAKSPPGTVQASVASGTVPKGATIGLGEAAIGRAAVMIERPAMYRIVGTVMNIPSPAMSRVVLLEEGKRLPLIVPYSKCRVDVDAGLQCPVGKFFYGEAGLVVASAGDAVPQGVWAGERGGGATPKPLPTSSLSVPAGLDRQIQAPAAGVNVQDVTDREGGGVRPEPGDGGSVLAEVPVAADVALNRPGRAIFHGGPASRP